jgi:hypothetical protein
MAVNRGWSADDDPLERTDRLPMQAGTFVDPDVADDAVPMEAPPIPSTTALARELDTVRAEFAAVRAEVDAVRAELARAGAELEAERTRSRDLRHALSERVKWAEVARARIDHERREAGVRSAEIRTLREALAARDAAFTLREAEIRALRLALERARSDGQAPKARASGAGAGESVDLNAEFVRLDGTSASAHVLMRRMRIGRAPGCEMHIDSSSVSRQHALLIMNSRDILIEDLQSTNGVLVNGRKISRQLLNDGDVVTLGEAQFRLDIKPGARAVAPAPGPAAVAPAAVAPEAPGPPLS